jgi:hypothetical protein
VVNVTRGVNGTTAAAHLIALRVEQLGAPIDTPNIHVVFPHALESNMLQIMNSQLVPGGTNNDVSAIYGDVQAGRIKPLAFHEMYMGGDFNNWFMAAGTPVELGFLGGRENPELLLQDNPLVNDVFLKDTITWKVRHEYGSVLVDHRLIDGNIVA